MDSRDPKNKEPWLHASESTVIHDDTGVHRLDIEQGLDAPEEIVVQIDACDPCSAVDSIADALSDPSPSLERGPRLAHPPVARTPRNLYLEYATEMLQRFADALMGLPSTIADQVVSHPLRTGALVGGALLAWFRPAWPARRASQALHMARDSVASAAGSAADVTSDVLDAATSGLRRAAGAVADTAGDAMHAARDGIAKAVSAAGERASDAVSSAREGIAGAAAAVSDHASAVMGAARDRLSGTHDVPGGEMGQTHEKGRFMGSVRDRVSDAVGATARQLSDVGSRVAAATSSTASSLASRGAAKLQRLPAAVAREPLYLCLASLGAGAVAGLMIPVSDQEMSVLAPARETVVEAARHEIDDMVTQVRQTFAAEPAEPAHPAAPPPAESASAPPSFGTLQNEFPSSQSLTDLEKPADVERAADPQIGLPTEQPSPALPRMSIHDQPFSDEEAIGDIHLRNDVHGEEHPF